MNRSLLSLVSSAILCGACLWTANAIAHQGGMSNDAYVGDTRHHLVTPGSGGCVRTGSWTAGSSSSGCGMSVVLQAGALFDFDKAVLKRAARKQLDALASNIMSTGGVEEISIIGHTDSMGPDAYNQELSVRRANAVKSYLVKKGIRSGMIVTSGMGESHPVASNDTAAGRAMNRRVEVNIDTGGE